MTEGQLRPLFDTEVQGNCFAAIPGLKITESVKADFFHHGWQVVEEPGAGALPRTNHDGHPEPVEQRVDARIPGDVVPGAMPVDVASQSLFAPNIDGLNLSEAERSYPDPRHIARGGPQMASR